MLIISAHFRKTMEIKNIVHKERSIRLNWDGLQVVGRIALSLVRLSFITLKVVGLG